MNLRITVRIMCPFTRHPRFDFGKGWVDEDLELPVLSTACMANGDARTHAHFKLHKFWSALILASLCNSDFF